LQKKAENPQGLCPGKPRKVPTRDMDSTFMSLPPIGPENLSVLQIRLRLEQITGISHRHDIAVQANNLLKPTIDPRGNLDLEILLSSFYFFHRDDNSLFIETSRRGSQLVQRALILGSQFPGEMPYFDGELWS